MDWFLYDNGLRHERVKTKVPISHSSCNNRRNFHIPPVFSSIESIKFLGPKIWELIPNEMKELESLWKFKRAIKLLKPTPCLCRMCKQYYYRIGFL